MSENKKGPGSSLANSQGTNKIHINYITRGTKKAR